MTDYMISLLLVHAAGCLLIMGLGIIRVLLVPAAAYPIMMLVPLSGPLAMVLFGIHLKRHPTTPSGSGSQLQLENEIYCSMGMEPSAQPDIVPLEEAMLLNPAGTRRNLMMDMVKESVVPLEEALTISSSQVRRKLMMDVLHSDTSKYYALLEQARLNDDVEVVHYATTAMSELNKKYDLMLAEFGKAVQADPEDAEALERYCGCLKQCLSLGLVKGAMLERRQRECIACCQKLCEKKPLEQNFRDLALQQMLAEDYEGANGTLQRLEEGFPNSEAVWLLRLQYYARRGDGITVQHMAASVWNGEIYLSRRAKEILAFWLDKGRDYDAAK